MLLRKFVLSWVYAIPLLTLGLMLPLTANAATAPSCGGCFYRGDANVDNSIDVSDANMVLDYLFKGGRAPCQQDSDFDNNNDLNITDAQNILSYSYLGGAGPAEPRFGTSCPNVFTDKQCQCTCRGETNGGWCLSHSVKNNVTAPCLDPGTKVVSGVCEYGETPRVTDNLRGQVVVSQPAANLSGWSCEGQIVNSQGGCRTCHQTTLLGTAFCLPNINRARPVLTDYTVLMATACPVGYKEVVHIPGTLPTILHCAKITNFKAVRGSMDCLPEKLVTVNSNIFSHTRYLGPNSDVCPKSIDPSYQWGMYSPISAATIDCVASQTYLACPAGDPGTRRCPLSVSAIQGLHIGASCNLGETQFGTAANGSPICGKRVNICVEK